MAIEIERKFLVCGDDWRALAVRSMDISQSYLLRDDSVSVRVRVIDGMTSTLTLKSSKAGLKRQEFEYDIPLDDAEQMIDLCRGATIVKTRFIVPWRSLCWEVDVFRQQNAGLVLAEIELEHERQVVELPSWIGQEVTHDPRYYNRSLTKLPFRTWHDVIRERIKA